MTPMMLGVLVTSTASGFLISRYGRYRAFPIVGTAIAAVGAVPALDARGCDGDAGRRRLHAAPRTRPRARDAGARARRPERGRLPPARRRNLGRDAVQAGRRLDRRLRLRRDLHEPARPRARPARSRTACTCRASASPAVVHHLPPAIHALYVAAVAAALHPVFLTAAGVMVGAFGLSWLLRDVPLRETAGSDAPARDVPADAYALGTSRGGSRNAGRGSGVAGAPATLRK